MKTLIIQLARFGDLIQTKRLIKSLSGPVHLCLDSSLCEVAKLLYPNIILHPIYAHGYDNTFEVLKHNKRVFDEIQKLSFNKVYNLNFSGLNFALSTLFEEKTVSGYFAKNGQNTRSKWFDTVFRLVKNRQISNLNISDIWAHLHNCPISPSEVNPIASPKGEGLGVVLAGRNSKRSLSVEALALNIQALFEKMQAPNIYLLGTKAESPIARNLIRKLPAKIIQKTQDLSGRTSWQDLFVLVQGLDLLLSPDTGTMHLAAHLGVPVYGQFLASALAFETGAYGLGHTVWQADKDCVPCAETTNCNHCSCLNAFSEPDYLLALSKNKALPEKLAISRLESDFDELGLIYKGEKANDLAHRRTIVRKMLLEYCLNQDLKMENTDNYQEILNSFYCEVDWMLPRIVS